jgi:cysteine desulfurase
MDSEATNAIYLDYAATTPMDRRVLAAMMPYFGERFGNPACRHAHGEDAQEAVEKARKQVAYLIGAEPEDIIFTSGATESNHLAIVGAGRPLAEAGRPHMITVTTEHKAVLEPFHCLEAEGCEVTYLDVGDDGLIDLDELAQAIRPETGLVSIMFANNETGVVQEILRIGKLCEKNGVVFHTDAAQAFGKLPIDVGRANIKLLSISGHKIYGPKGIGALYARGGAESGLEPQMTGGGQECGMRGGTSNVPAIVGLGAAAEIAQISLSDDAQHVWKLRCRLLELLEDDPGDVQETAPGVSKLPGHLHVAFAGAPARDVLRALQGRVSATSASACSEGSGRASHVMEAMGHPDPGSTIRFTIGRMTSSQCVERAAGEIAEAVRKTREGR